MMDQLYCALSICPRTAVQLRPFCSLDPYAAMISFGDDHPIDAFVR
jgi:hypothetical protein